ncbi:hypothetical protein B7494_g1554 [Chlorociboria aeruginascens]|nr:hypothetical protein B7494_g1554 [Chlorociboria aeruginascens]
MAKIDELPDEIILHLTRFLNSLEIVNLQLICRRFLALARDNTLWRERCFTQSSFLESLRRRQALLGAPPEHELQFRDLARALANGNGLDDSRLLQPRGGLGGHKAQSNERIRILANWDPSYLEEEVNWYDEYIARNAPISTSWLQQPRNRDTAEHEHLEVRGMGLYTPVGESGSSLVLAPLDDGSVCIWDLSGSRGRKGGIVAKSKSGILYVDNTPRTELNKRSRMISTGVTECVSVDSFRKRAYIAVQSGLVEVDLETLLTVGHEKFPFSITALSESKYPVPLTVGTNLSLYLHDPRVGMSHSDSHIEQIDSFDMKYSARSVVGSLNLGGVLNPEPRPDYTHLHQPGPLSILHMSTSGDNWDGNGDIYVAGRFPSILNYDRRYFPKLRGTIHSGARLCSMASLPYAFSAVNSDLARRGELSMEQVWESKNRPGKTLIACGEYNSKGSLEIYGLSPNPDGSNITSSPSAGRVQNSTMKNRQTSSSSKLLSVSNHGTRIVVSDGGGNLKWLERDGFTEVRRWNIAQGSVEAPRGIFGTLGDSYMDSGSGDIALKIASTRSVKPDNAVNDDELVIWTGEKIGLLSFSRKPGFTGASFEETAKTVVEEQKEREERIYSSTMRRALEEQANEVRYVRGLGLRLGGSP